MAAISAAHNYDTPMIIYQSADDESKAGKNVKAAEYVRGDIKNDPKADRIRLHAHMIGREGGRTLATRVRILAASSASSAPSAGVTCFAKTLARAQNKKKVQNLWSKIVSR